jgi:hypothetical protein
MFWLTIHCRIFPKRMEFEGCGKSLRSARHEEDPSTSGLALEICLTAMTFFT